MGEFNETNVQSIMVGVVIAVIITGITIIATMNNTQKNAIEMKKINCLEIKEQKWK